MYLIGQSMPVVVYTSMCIICDLQFHLFVTKAVAMVDVPAAVGSPS